MTSPWLNFLLAGYALALVLSFRLHLSRIVLAATWILHAFFVGLRWIQGGHPPFASLYDTLVFFAWAVVLAYLVLGKPLARRPWLAGVLGLVLTALGFAFFMDASARPLLPALQSHWISIHVVTCFLAYGAFGVAFVLSLARLFGRGSEALDGLIVKAVELGIPFLTVGIIAGSVWANETWGTYWSWDPKETWALITWLIYAIFLHGCRMHRWGGRRLAGLCVAGFAAVLFSFVVVNFFLGRLHRYV